MKKQSISPWKMNTFGKCGEQYRLLMIERHPFVAKHFFARGNAVGETAGTAHNRQIRRKKESSDPLPITLKEACPSAEEAKDLAADVYAREIENAESDFILDPKDEEAGLTIEQVEGREKDNAIGMAAHYVEEVAPTINPIAVERRIAVDLKGTPWRLSGVPDIVEEQTPEVVNPVQVTKTKELITPTGEEIGTTLRIIRDTKTKVKAPSATEADTSDQLSFYALLDKLDTGKVPDAMVLDHVVRTPGGKKTKPKVYTKRQYTTRTDDDLRNLYRKLNVVTEAIEKEVYLPAPQGSWWCSKRMCQFWGTHCRYTRTGARRPTS
jgi:hypothetical protein